MSSPHVAATAALIWSHHPNATTAEIRLALESSAVQLDESQQGGRNDVFGWGVVNAKLALEALGPSAPSISPSPTLNPTITIQPSNECMPFELRILPNDYPTETSLELFDPRGDVIASSVEEDPLENGKLFEFEKCL